MNLKTLDIVQFLTVKIFAENIFSCDHLVALFLASKVFFSKQAKCTSFFVIFTNFFVYCVKFCSRLTSQILYTLTIIWCNTGNRGGRKLELFQNNDLWCLKDPQASTLLKRFKQLSVSDYHRWCYIRFSDLVV